MKKTILTLSCLALFSVMANAQATDKATQKQDPAAAQRVNPDGTTSPVGVEPANAEKAAVSIKADDAAAPAQAAPAETKKDRHAITEKGVPASKSKDTKPATEKKPAAAGDNK